MTEEEAFLATISANPDDFTTRLVYADWLEDQGDPRSELVRLQVRLAKMTPADSEYASLKARELELRGRCPPRWLAILDPAVWCLAGNIAQEHPSGPDGEEMRRGTRLFRPNAKIYLADTRHCWALCNPELGPNEGLQVVGQHRKSRQWILCYVRVRYTVNWRVQLVRQPGAIIRLRRVRWPGFHLKAGEFPCPEERQSEATVAAFLNAICAAERREWEQQLGGSRS